MLRFATRERNAVVADVHDARRRPCNSIMVADVRRAAREPIDRSRDDFL